MVLAWCTTLGVSMGVKFNALKQQQDGMQKGKEIKEVVTLGLHGGNLIFMCGVIETRTVDVAQILRLIGFVCHFCSG